MRACLTCLACSCIHSGLQPHQGQVKRLVYGKKAVSSQMVGGPLGDELGSVGDYVTWITKSSFIHSFKVFEEVDWRL